MNREIYKEVYEIYRDSYILDFMNTNSLSYYEALEILLEKIKQDKFKEECIDELEEYIWDQNRFEEEYM